MAVQLRIGAGHIAALGVHGKAIGIATLAAGEAQVRAAGGVNWDNGFVGEEFLGGGLNGAPQLGIGGGLRGIFGDEVLDFYLIAMSPSALRRKSSRSSWVWPGKGRTSISR